MLQPKNLFLYSHSVGNPEPIRVRNTSTHWRMSMNLAFLVRTGRPSSLLMLVLSRRLHGAPRLVEDDCAFVLHVRTHAQSRKQRTGTTRAACKAGTAVTEEGAAAGVRFELQIRSALRIVRLGLGSRSPKKRWHDLLFTRSPHASTDASNTTTTTQPLVIQQAATRRER